MTRLHPLLAVAATLVVVAALRVGKPLFIPIALAAVLSLLLAPLVRGLERLRVPRPVAAPLVVVAFAVAVGGVGFVVSRQVIALARELPRYRSNIEEKLTSLRPLSSFTKRVKEVVQDVREEEERPGARRAPDEPVKVEVVDQGPDQLTLAGGVLAFLADVAQTAAIALLLVAFFLVEQSDIVDRILRLAGPSQVTVTTQALYEAAHGVSRYLGAQALLNGAFGLTLTGGLLLLGVPNAPLWGLLGGLLRFLPYVGPVVGCSLPVLLAFAVFDGWSRPLTVLGFVVAVELLLTNVVEPLAYATRTGLSPVAVILSALAWGWLWGPLGLLLAVPLSVCLAAAGRCVPALSFLAVVLGRDPPIEPPVALYHRLLAGKHAQALDLLERGLGDGTSLEARLDQLLLPVVAHARHDVERGGLAPARAAALLDDVRQLVGELAEGGTPGEPAGPVGVLCLPASEPTDEVVGEMLARCLELAGLRTSMGTLAALTHEKAELVVEAGADVVCLSALASGNLLRLRYLYKRLRRRFPELQIVVLAWGLEEGASPTRLAPDGRATIAGSLVDASQAVRVAAQLAAHRG